MKSYPLAICFSLLVLMTLNACSSSSATPQNTAVAASLHATLMPATTSKILPERVEKVVTLAPVFVHPSAEDLKEAGL